MCRASQASRYLSGRFRGQSTFGRRHSIAGCIADIAGERTTNRGKCILRALPPVRRPTPAGHGNRRRCRDCARSASQHPARTDRHGPAQGHCRRDRRGEIIPTASAEAHHPHECTQVASRDSPICFASFGDAPSGGEGRLEAQARRADRDPPARALRRYGGLNPRCALHGQVNGGQLHLAPPVTP
jgi:hypothetical protein